MDEPKTFNQAVKHQVWIDVMNVEIQALNQNETWDITDFLMGRNPLVVNGSTKRISNLMDLLKVIRHAW